MTDLHYEIYIAGTPQQVWDALTKPEGVKQLYYGSVIESDFKVGSDMAYVGPGKGGERTVHVYGKFLEFEPGKVFAHTLKVGDAYGEDRKNFETHVAYRMEAMGSTTKLMIVQDQWDEGDPAYAGSKAGWSMLLSSLKSLVETGKPLDFAAVAHG
jgi:uncharacterized protein YndB with AHSA1/START domain